MPGMINPKEKAVTKAQMKTKENKKEGEEKEE